MRVTLTTHGGLAAAINLRRPPRVVDSDTLTEAAAEELTQLVAAAKAAATPAEPTEAGPGRAPDEMSYTITVEDGGHQVVLAESDTTMSQEFAALLNWLEERS